MKVKIAVDTKTMEIKFVDLKQQYKGIKPEVDTAVQRTIENASFILGPDVEKFEEDFAMFCGTQYAVGLNSGTSALFLALHALGVGPGDEVITQANTFIATAAAISAVGATPVFADSNLSTYQIDVEDAEKRITAKTKVIIPVHLYGTLGPIEEIVALAKKHNLFILEDACQAHGAERGGRKAGSFGDIAAFSFYPGKNLGAYGDAGAIVTNNKALAEKIKLLRDHGSPQKYIHDVIGYNMRMEGIHGAVLGVKLKYLAEWSARRREHAAEYCQLLGGISEIVLPEITGKDQVFHLFVIRTKKRDALQEYLKKAGVQTNIHYPIPIHLQKAYVGLGLGVGSYPKTETVAGEILSLPMYPELSGAAIQYIARTIKEFFAQ